MLACKTATGLSAQNCLSEGAENMPYAFSRVNKFAKGV